MSAASTQSGAPGASLLREEFGSARGPVNFRERERLPAVTVVWNFGPDVLTRVWPGLLGEGAVSGSLEIEVEPGVRAVARVNALGGAGGAMVIAQSTSPARYVSDAALGLEHLDAAGFVAITWRSGAPPGSPFYARSGFVDALGIPGGRMEEPAPEFR